MHQNLKIVPCYNSRPKKSLNSSTKMNKYQTDDVRISNQIEVVAPKELINEYPITEGAAKTTGEARDAIRNILLGNDDRLLVVVGPCSVHDVDATFEYAKRLKTLHEELIDDLFIVMRIYFEKPRTTVGWKGLINDPDLDESFNINKGLRLARSLLLNIAESGLPTATEYLDLISPQYIADLVGWGAIGARTTESQGHRELSSGLSCPVGFKNGTSGELKIAIDALESASRPHCFLSISKQGHTAIFQTKGNKDCHIILRGGDDGPNYSPEHIHESCEMLAKRGLSKKLMVDCSHANSYKDYNRQIEVADSIAQQIANGEHAIMGTMIESNLEEGNQKVIAGTPLKYGVSITDSCIDWDSTRKILKDTLAPAVRKRRQL